MIFVDPSHTFGLCTYDVDVVFISFQTSLTHFSAFIKIRNFDFRRLLSHIRLVYISCLIWFTLFSCNTHTFRWFHEIKKSMFVDPSHTFGLCTCDAWCGFLSFSDNTHTLWCFMNILHLIVCQTRSILWDVLRWSRAGTWNFPSFIMHSRCSYA